MRQGCDGPESLLRPPDEAQLRTRPRFLALLAVVLAATGCLRPVATLDPPRADEPTRPVWVLGHGWHTSLVVRREDVDRRLWPEVDDFPGARFVEVAWGDRDFYMAERGSLWQALMAAFAPSGSVLHVAGFSPPVEVYFPASEIVEVQVSLGGFEAMSRFFRDGYRRDASGRPLRLRTGLYGASAFYAATGTYHLLNTCNTWVARALEAGGVPIIPDGMITAGNVLDEVRRLGRRLQRPAHTSRS